MKKAIISDSEDLDGFEIIEEDDLQGEVDCSEVDFDDEEEEEEDLTAPTQHHQIDPPHTLLPPLPQEREQLSEDSEDHDLFDYEGDKGVIDEFNPEDFEEGDGGENNKRFDMKEDAKKAISKKKSLVKRYLANIGCKDKRLELVVKRKIEIKRLKNKLRRKAKNFNEQNPDKVQKPITTEDNRIVDSTFLFNVDHELEEEEACDEFSPYFEQLKDTKIFITTSMKPWAETFKFVKEIKECFPNMYYYPRKEFNINYICKAAAERGYSHVVVVRERLKKPYELYMICLPYGPTMVFKLSSIKLRKTLRNHGNPTGHHPELILKNFNSSLGRRVGRFFGSMFPQDPQFKARTVVSFLNMRDFIFFRHHRYIFQENGERCRLQEVGPRFTLKLKKIAKGLNDKFPEIEWKLRNDMYTSRRRHYI